MRMEGFVSGGSLAANRGPVEWTCPVERHFFGGDHTLLEVKWGKEGRERKAPAILSITHFTIVNIVDRAGRYIPRRKRLVKKEDRNSNQYITRNTE